MKQWTDPDSIACQSRAFCLECRTDSAFRQTLVDSGRAAGRDFECPFGVTADAIPAPRQPPQGPGGHLKALLAAVGIHASKTCLCNAMAFKMDREGPHWCREHMSDILEVMRAEAGRRGLPFVEAAARWMIRRAIRKTEGGFPG